jgi:hypothetical protein
MMSAYNPDLVFRYMSYTTKAIEVNNDVASGKRIKSWRVHVAELTHEEQFITPTTSLTCAKPLKRLRELTSKDTKLKNSEVC